MKWFWVAVIISGWVLFCIPGSARARVDHRLTAAERSASPGVVTSASLQVNDEGQTSLDTIFSEPWCIALSGIGLLFVGGIIRRRRSDETGRKSERSLDRALYPAE